MFIAAFHKCQNLEATKTSFSRWMDKKPVVQTMQFSLVLKKIKLSSKSWHAMEEP